MPRFLRQHIGAQIHCQNRRLRMLRLAQRIRLPVETQASDILAENTAGKFENLTAFLMRLVKVFPHSRILCALAGKQEGAVVHWAQLFSHSYSSIAGIPPPDKPAGGNFTVFPQRMYQLSAKMQRHPLRIDVRAPFRLGQDEIHNAECQKILRRHTQ